MQATAKCATTVSFPAETYRRLKMLCLVKDMKFTELINEMAEARLKKEAKAIDAAFNPAVQISANQDEVTA